MSALPSHIPAEILRFKLRDFFQDKGYEIYDIVVYVYIYICYIAQDYKNAQMNIDKYPQTEILAQETITKHNILSGDILFF